MADRAVDILLIGGGIASATAAATLREEGHDGSVLVVGRELDAPYHRPPSTKGYLRGEESRADALVHPEGWWEQHDVELRTRTSVLALDPAARTAKLSTKEEVAFDRALLATGAMVRRLDADGAQLEGIHYVRAPGNADAVRADAEAAQRVVCVGGSYIGCEVAASLTAMGKQVTVLHMEDEPLAHHFGTAAGRHVRAVLEGHGVELVSGEQVARFEGAERVEAVATSGGRRLAADLVVCGVGAVPDVMLARRAGLEIGELGGVRCDRALRTSAPGIVAAGDMCEFDSVLHGGPARIEHEEVAAAQGATAARTLLGADRPHDVVPYFFSDLADWLALEYVGLGGAFDEEVVRGDPAAGDGFAVWHLAAGRVRGVLSVDGAADLDAARELIAGGEPVGAAALPG